MMGERDRCTAARTSTRSRCIRSRVRPRPPRPRPLGSPLPLLWPHRDSVDRRPVLGSIPEPGGSVALRADSITSAAQLDNPASTDARADFRFCADADPAKIRSTGRGLEIVLVF